MMIMQTMVRRTGSAEYADHNPNHDHNCYNYDDDHDCHHDHDCFYDNHDDDDDDDFADNAFRRW